jgi:glutamine amidotransferase
MIAIVKYNAGNSTSVKNAVERLGFTCTITNDHQALKNASKVIFPGVGAASRAMTYLKETGLDKIIIALQKPVLGICLGQQLLCAHSEEGNVDCLGIFNAQVKKFPPYGSVPHMGWNTLAIRPSQALFKNITEQDDVYFVHSYYCELSKYTIASCDYITTFSAAMQKDNFYATQFHPEKSASVGEKILNNFLQL